MDRIDRKILNIFQFDTRRIAESIGEEVGLSAAAVQRRLKRFRRQMIDHPMVQQCYHVTGTYDFVVIVIANSMEAYGVFARKCFESNKYVTRFDTHVALERVKVGLSLPIEDLR